MEVLKLEGILRSKTMDLFSDKWYLETSQSIFNSFSESNSLGYVYFLRGKTYPYIKIGKSKDLNTRVRTLETNLGKLTILGFIYCEDYDLLEKKLHSQFKEKRKHGEWFDLNSSEVRTIVKENDGLFINRDNKTIIINGIVEDPLFEEDLKKESFFKMCDETFLNSKIHTNEELFSIFFDLNISKKKIKMFLSEWAEKKDYLLINKNSSGKRSIELII